MVVDGLLRCLQHPLVAWIDCTLAILFLAAAAHQNSPRYLEYIQIGDALSVALAPQAVSPPSTVNRVKLVHDYLNALALTPAEVDLVVDVLVI